MTAFRHHFRWLGLLIALVIVASSIAAPAAQAARIGTATLAEQASASEARERIDALLERADVRAELERLGVDPAQAEQRVAALSDAEAQRLAGRIEELPNGGSIIGAAVFIFLVLLVTDILGFTDVFPFVTKTAR